LKDDSEKPVKKNTLWHSERLREEVRNWPAEVKEEMGGQLNKVEYGGYPDDFKPMQTIGAGVHEIRVSEKGDQYRLIYIAKFVEAIYVLHVITKKKTQQTAQSDIDTAKKRYNELIERRRKLKL
jgi:phage-related protein